MTRAVFTHRIAALALAGLALSAQAEDRAVIDATQIIGNRELPKVIYIVPWKKPGASELPARAPASVLDDVLAPLDRDVFRRQLQYGSALLQAADAAKAAPPPTATRP